MSGRPGAGPWLHDIRLTPPSPTQRLLAFPPSAAGPAALRPLLRSLPDTVRVIGVALPGRGPRLDEPPGTCLDEILDSIEAELARQPALPTVLFGHSLGGLLAALCADRLGDRANALVISGSDPCVRAEALTRTMDEVIEAAGVTTSDVLADPEWRAHLYRVMHADLELAAEARSRLHNVRIGVPVTVLGGTADPLVSVGALADWQHHSLHPVTVEVFDGGHFYLLTEGVADRVLPLLQLDNCAR